MVMLYPFYVLASLLATLVAYLCINWWAPLWCDAQGNLPRWLKWFQTFDASCDAGWQDGYLDKSWGSTPLRRFLARVYWLYRNPAYGWDYWPLGVRWNPDDWSVFRDEDTPQRTLFIAVNFDGAFNLYYSGRWGQYKIGWKAYNKWDGKDWHAPNWAKYDRIPLCFTINPFKRPAA